ncbi:MAG: methyltransferase domain-containing protein [Betaproteobacteria bacterium]|nr:methyltransferase domain-containing protein [Betaproteobacteria bacterium]
MTYSACNTICLNLGCGNKGVAGYIGVDRFPGTAANVLCDLGRSLPFRDNSVDAFLLDNVIEHLTDIPALMMEIARVGKRGAQVTIVTPHFTSLSSWRDPTHVHHLSYFSFDHFEKPSVSHYVGNGLRVASRRLSFGGGVLGLIGRMLFALSPEAYEKKYCFMFRASTLHFQLEVLRD